MNGFTRSRLRSSAGSAVVTALVVLCSAPAAVRARGNRDAAPVIEMVTYHPGDGVWERFGHTAIRVRGAAAGSDLVLSFGCAGFDRLGFLWEYLRGTSEFTLCVRTYQNALARYRRANRTLELHRLNLSADQSRLLVARLRHNMRPEHRAYRYQQLRDNCATRVRDLLDEVTGGALRRAAKRRHQSHTFRHYTLTYSAGRLDVLLALDFIAGPNQDRRVGPWELLYLPMLLREAVVAAALEGPEGRRPLAQPGRFGYRRQGPAATGDRPFAGRWLVVGVGLALALVISGTARRRSHPLFARAGGVALGVAGLWLSAWGAVVWLLVATSKVPDFGWNENLVCWVPTDVAFAVAGWRWVRSGRAELGMLWRWYAAARLLGIGALAVGTAVGLCPQDNWAFILAPAFILGILLGHWPPLLGSHLQTLFARSSIAKSSK